MAVVIDGGTGVSKVQDGVIATADFASGAITSSVLPSGSQVLISEDADGGTGLSALEVTLPIGSTYDHYILKIDGFYFSSSGQDLVSQIAVSGTYQTGASDYRYVGPAAQSAVAVNRNGSNGNSYIRFGWYSSGDASAEASVLHLQIWDSMESSVKTRMFGVLNGQTDSNETMTVLTGGFRASAEVNDKIKFYGHTGGSLNYASYQLYGVLA